MIFGFFQKRVSSPIEQSRAGRAEQTEWRKSRKSREQEESKKQKAESRADDSKCGMVRIATFIFHWKLFPSFAIIRIKYQTKNNNINL